MCEQLTQDQGLVHSACCPPESPHTRRRSPKLCLLFNQLTQGLRRRLVLSQWRDHRRLPTHFASGRPHTINRSPPAVPRKLRRWPAGEAGGVFSETGLCVVLCPSYVDLKSIDTEPNDQ